MADKRSGEEIQDDSAKKRTTRASAAANPMPSNLQKEVAAFLNTGKKSATKAASVSTKNDGPLPSTGAVRKGTITKQPIPQNLTLPSQQPNAGSNILNEASQHSLPDESDESAHDAPQQVDEDGDVLILNADVQIEDVTKQPVPTPGQYASSNVSGLQPSANVSTLPSTVSNFSMQPNASELTSMASATAVRSQANENFLQQQLSATIANIQRSVSSAQSSGKENHVPAQPNVTGRNAHSPVTEIATQMNAMDMTGWDKEAELKLVKCISSFMDGCCKHQTGMERLLTLSREENLQLEAAQTQVEMLEKYYKRIYDRVKMMEEIEMPANYGTAYNEYLQGIDERYMQIKAELVRNVNRLSANAQPTERSATGTRNPLDDLQLQRVRIERFAGDYRKWPNFKSKFEQFFHHNAAVPNATKFFRLDEHIENDSEPYQLIAGFERVAENYNMAWEYLCGTYDNKRKLVDEIINNFIDLPPMPSATRGNLMVIINAVNHLTKSLIRYEEVMVQHWDPIIVNLLLRKLDNETKSRWNHERPQRQVAKLQPLMQFLENRAESMEGGVTTASSKPRPMQPSNRQNEPPQAQGEQGAVGGSDRRQYKREVKCCMCGAEHQLFSCPTFRKLPLDERWKRVREFHVCENCLRPKCEPQRCKLGPCKVCNHKHNGLLCGKANGPTVATTIASDGNQH